MRNNNTGGRSIARGNGRKGAGAERGASRRQGQERPARKSRYLADEGSVRHSAENGSAKRSYRKSSFAEENDRPKFRSNRSTSAAASGSSFKRDSFKKDSFKSDSFKKDSFKRDSYKKDAFSGDAPKREYRGKGQAPRAKAQVYTPSKHGKATSDEGVRLNKYISNSGICSRREADDYITAGVVSVNDVIITELGTKVYPGDVVKFNGERIKGEEKVYIVMNKPKDFVTTVSDPFAEKTVVGLVQGLCKARVYPVGRLDKATTGVLLLTNDGEMADKLTHPSFEKKKIYHVHLDKNLKGTDMNQLVNGIYLEDGFIQVDEISYVDDDKTQVGVEIHSGRNRIIRRMFEHLGYKVKKLDRVYFAGLTKKNLRRGQWRFLTEQEVAMLKMGSFE